MTEFGKLCKFDKFTTLARFLEKTQLIVFCILFTEICECGDPPRIVNGVVNPGVGPVPCNNFVRYQCNVGYEIVGSDNIQCVNRAYSGNSPRCQGTFFFLQIFGLKYSQCLPL